ncbi:hypothetical protein BH23BAC1_BH23BAC1_26680 [soil metagenome]
MGNSLSLIGFFILALIAFIFPSNASHDPEVVLASNNLESPVRIPLKLTNDLSNIYELRTVDSVFSQFIRRWNIAGASVAISKDGRLIYAKGFGKADKEEDIDVQPEHLFRVASVSKLITAVGIMKLIEDGEFGLDSKVFGPKGILNDTIYSNIADRRIYDITVRHLLKHQGGWSASMGDPMFETLDIALKMNVPPPADPVTVTKYVLSKKLHFKPGTKSSYSNLGYNILGQIIEVVSGSTYEDFINQAVLYPLGIDNMTIGKNMIIDRAMNEVAYYDHGKALARLSVYGTGDFVPRTYDGSNIEGLGAAGGWIATPAQLLKIVMAIDGMNSKADILCPETIEWMTTNVEQGGSPFGWRGVDDKGNWWRTGTLAGTSALVMRQPDGINFAVVLNSSTYTGSRFTTEINKAMKKALSNIEEWPKHDLLKFYEPTVVLPIPPKDWPVIKNNNPTLKTISFK